MRLLFVVMPAQYSAARAVTKGLVPRYGRKIWLSLTYKHRTGTISTYEFHIFLPVAFQFESFSVNTSTLDDIGVVECQDRRSGASTPQKHCSCTNDARAW